MGKTKVKKAVGKTGKVNKTVGPYKNSVFTQNQPFPLGTKYKEPFISVSPRGSNGELYVDNEVTFSLENYKLPRSGGYRRKYNMFWNLEYENSSVDKYLARKHKDKGTRARKKKYFRERDISQTHRGAHYYLTRGKMKSEVPDKHSLKMGFHNRTKGKMKFQVPGRHLLKVTVKYGYGHGYFGVFNHYQVQCYFTVLPRRDAKKEYEKDLLKVMDPKSYRTEQRKRYLTMRKELTKKIDELKLKKLTLPKEYIKFLENRIEFLSDTLTQQIRYVNNLRNVNRKLAKEKKRIIPLSTKLIIENEPRNAQLILYAYETTEGWKIVDHTSPMRHFEFDGKYPTDVPKTKSLNSDYHRKAFLAAFDNFKEYNKNPKGVAICRFPTQFKFKDHYWIEKTKGFSNIDEIKKWFDAVGIIAGIGILALYAVPEPSGATKVLATTLSLTAAGAGAASSGLSIYERVQRGNLALDKDTVIDTASLAMSLISIGSTVKNLRYARLKKAGKAGLLAGVRNSRWVCLTGAGALMLDATKGVIFTVETWKKIKMITNPEYKLSLREQKEMIQGILIGALTNGHAIVMSVKGFKGDYSTYRNARTRRTRWETVSQIKNHPAYKEFKEVHVKKKQEFRKYPESGTKTFQFYDKGGPVETNLIPFNIKITSKQGPDPKNLKKAIKMKLLDSENYLPGHVTNEILIDLKGQGHMLDINMLKQLKKDIEDMRYGNSKITITFWD
ncbi:MAG: hypothetical protein GY760_09290 [Deltaproteobacteria bacterium]|nr:hypothetical protein [Deltaproteobacteria bacterium]